MAAVFQFLNEPRSKSYRHACAVSHEYITLHRQQQRNRQLGQHKPHDKV